MGAIEMAAKSGRGIRSKVVGSRPLTDSDRHKPSKRIRSIDEEWEPSKGSIEHMVHDMDPNVCERCGNKEGVELEDSRTMYHWDGKGENPNRSVFLCRACAEDHHDFWEAQWSDYHSGRL
jgi:hypothetical protein